MNYYRIRPDLKVAQRWVLGDVRHIDNWLLIDPPVNFMEPGRYALDVAHVGCETDYTLAGYASAPVVSRKFLDALSGLPDVDAAYEHVVFEPVLIEGQDVVHEYYLMIVETQIDCLDEWNSEFVRFEEHDSVRPDLAGQIRAFHRLCIDADRVRPWHIFRMREHLSALIVSEEVKLRLESAAVVGIHFETVSSCG